MAHQAVAIPMGDSALSGELAVPRWPIGLVVQVTTSGWFDPRHRAIAMALRQREFATLQCDLLTPEEDRQDQVSFKHRFDVPLLGRRLLDALSWIDHRPELRGMPIGLFGARTEAAATWVAASEKPDRVAAVVTLSGRPDLAGDALGRVKAPTLLVAGAQDPATIGLSEHAMRSMPGPVRLVLVPGATQLFNERGALERMFELAASFFADHLARAPRAA